MKGFLCLVARGLAPVVLLLGLVAMGGNLAWAQSATAYFEDGGTPGVDTYPGIAGDGWYSPWVQTTYHTGSTATLETVDLVDSGNYLHYEINSGFTDGGYGSLMRDYTAGIDVTKAYTVDFKFRIDENLQTFLNGDQVNITDQPEYNATYSNPSWWIHAGPRDDEYARNANWYVIAEDESGVKYLHDTGFALQPTGYEFEMGGPITTFSLEVDPTTQSWDVSISDGIQPDYDSRNMGEPNLVFYQTPSPAGKIMFSLRTSSASEPHAYSLDSLAINGSAPPYPPNPHPGIVSARFDDASGTGVDTYPGKTGEGWADAWKATEFHGTLTATLTSDSPVVDSGNYLRVQLFERQSADNGAGTVCRDYGYDAVNNPDGIDLTKSHSVSFKMRFTDYDSLSFSSINDAIYICDNDREVAANTNGATSWAVYARGDLVTGGQHYWSMLATDDDGASYAWFPTIQVKDDEVVTCMIEVDPENSTWDLLISDSTDSWDSRTDLPSGFVPMYWPGGPTGPGGFFMAGARTETSDEYRTLEFDSVVISQVSIPGDANCDGRVDKDDAQILALYWGSGTETEPATWAEGNFDGDYVVGAKDAAILAANWGYGTAGGEGNVVPEPSAIVMLLAAAMSGLLTSRRRR